MFNAAVQLGFDIAAFTAVMVLMVLGLVLEATILRRFYNSSIVVMLGTHAIGLIIREWVRGLLGGQYKIVPEPLQCFLSVMLDGVGTFEGPVLGAAAAGAMAAGLPRAVPPVLADPRVFIIDLIVVRFRPQGFISKCAAAVSAAVRERPIPSPHCRPRQALPCPTRSTTPMPTRARPHPPNPAAGAFCRAAAPWQRLAG